MFARDAATVVDHAAASGEVPVLRTGGLALHRRGSSLIARMSKAYAVLLSESRPAKRIRRHFSAFVMKTMTDSVRTKEGAFGFGPGLIGTDRVYQITQ